jgi:hypothetical protein
MHDFADGLMFTVCCVGRQVSADGSKPLIEVLSKFGNSPGV